MIGAWVRDGQRGKEAGQRWGETWGVPMYWPEGATVG